MTGPNGKIVRNGGVTRAEVRMPRQKVVRPILVVEDDLATRDALVELLRGAGFPVLASDEGRKALELAQVIAPSVVILDLEMPGMNGREFLARRKDFAGVHRIPVVVVSGGGVRDVEADAVLPKPFDAQELVATVARLSSR